MPPIPWEYIVSIIVALVGSQGLWTLIANRKGKFKKIEAKLQSIQDEIDGLKIDLKRGEASGWRRDILTFDSSLRKDEKHTQEEFIEILSLIDDYELYCETHPGYRNNKAKVAIANIKENYAERQRLRDYI